MERNAKQRKTSGLLAHAEGLRRTQAGVAIAILVLVGFHAFRLRGPLPEPIDAPPSVSSGMRARQVIAETIGTPGRIHPNGSAENARVRDRLVRRLQDLGFEVDIEEGPSDGYLVSNIIALRRGSDPRLRPLMLASHYDSSPYAPGAGDAGIAFSAILETVRALRHQPDLQRDLYVVLTDAEERGLKGAKRLVEIEHPVLKRRPIVFNFDARGSLGPCLMFETSHGDLYVVRAAAPSLPAPIYTSSLFVYVYKRLPRGTDFTQWKRAGLTGLNFALVGGAWNHHQPTDTLENVSRRTNQHYCDTTLAMVQRFDAIDDDGWLAIESPPDGVFFSLLSLLVITLSREAMQWIAIIGLLVSLVVLVRTASPRHASLALVAILATLCLVTAVGFALGAMFRATPLAEHRFTPIGSYVALCYAAVAVTLIVTAGSLLARWVPPATSFATVLVIWSASGCAAAFLAPGTSYLLSIPALLMALLLLPKPKSLFARAAGIVVAATFFVPELMLLQQVIGPGEGTLYSAVVGASSVPLIGLCRAARR